MDEVTKFYVQNGDFKGVYRAFSFEIAAQMAVLDIVEKDHWQFAPFIVVSSSDFDISTVNKLQETTDEIKLLLTYNVINSIAKYVDEDQKEHKAWLELAKRLQETTIAFDGGDRYHDLVRSLI